VGREIFSEPPRGWDGAMSSVAVSRTSSNSKGPESKTPFPSQKGVVGAGRGEVGNRTREIRRRGKIFLIAQKRLFRERGEQVPFAC